MNATEFCSALTKRSRSNFYYAFVFLPKAKREAMYAVYAFCRSVDDVVDLGGEPSLQRKELERWRQEVARCYEGIPQDPVTEQLARAIRVFPIPRQALEEIVAGVQMDLERSSYETFEELSLYCYRVAGAVGLACIEIFGYTDPRAKEYAKNLGTALQLTNILRDLQADANRAGSISPRRTSVASVSAIKT